MSAPESTDPRVKGTVCGITRTFGGSIEWICIRPPHGREDERSMLPRPYGGADESERHHMVNRWPGGKPRRQA